MKAVDAEEYARKLKAAQGNKALAEAAQKAVMLEKSGQAEEAKDWRQIEKALLNMRGPGES